MTDVCHMFSEPKVLLIFLTNTQKEIISVKLIIKIQINLINSEKEGNLQAGDTVTKTAIHYLEPEFISMNAPS